MALSNDHLKALKSQKTPVSLDFSSPVSGNKPDPIPEKKPEDVVDFNEANKILEELKTKGAQESQQSPKAKKEKRVATSPKEGGARSGASSTAEQTNRASPNTQAGSGTTIEQPTKSARLSRLVAITFSEFKANHAIEAGKNFSGSVPSFAKSMQLSTRSMQNYLSKWRKLGWIEIVADYDPVTKSDQVYRIIL